VRNTTGTWELPSMECAVQYGGAGPLVLLEEAERQHFLWL
jgi:hypothetical protein